MVRVVFLLQILLILVICIQTLILTLINFSVNIIQNTNLMPLLDKSSSSSGHSAIRFSLLHLNIRSLNRNFDNLVNYLASIKSNFSVIEISETWLIHSNHTFDIDGYI